jgi:TatD DNase family protein
MLFDTHCHLDAAEYDADRDAVVDRAIAAGVRGILIPAVAPDNFDRVRALAHAIPGGAYALGIHPMVVARCPDDALNVLRQALEANLGDPRLVAVGEIGLDFFVPELATGPHRERQERFFDAQLRLAAELRLPVLLHVRRAQDTILKYLRLRRVSGGIAHAFNGSVQQAEAFIALGFALGIGGAMTYARATRIRLLAASIDLSALVLETDGPDIPPAWLGGAGRNEPAELAPIAHALAHLRGVSPEQIADDTTTTALRVCPKLATLWSNHGDPLKH